MDYRLGSLGQDRRKFWIGLRPVRREKETEVGPDCRVAVNGPWCVRGEGTTGRGLKWGVSDRRRVVGGPRGHSWTQSRTGRRRVSGGSS